MTKIAVNTTWATLWCEKVPAWPALAKKMIF
jgi:hypothetical protein